MSSADITHLQTRVADALRRRVTGGTLRPGSKLPPFREIAREFGVSTMTVTKALDALERERRVYRVARVGAFVAGQPGNGGYGSSHVLAFAVASLQSPIAAGFTHGIEKACHDHGWGLQIFNAHLDENRERRNFERIVSSHLEGVIVMPPCTPPCIALMARMQREGFPLVVVDQMPPGLEADFVASDHEAGAYQATSHLLSRGFEFAYMVTTQPLFSGITARIRGYEQALRDAGIEPRSEWKVWIDQSVHTAGYLENRKWLGGYRAALPFLRTCKPPLAILAIDGYVQWGVYEACRELGLRIPDDVSVVGFDDSEITQVASPPMTLISQRMDEIGRTAVELLLKRIEAGPAQLKWRRTFFHEIVGVDLIERGSVRQVQSAKPQADPGEG